MTIKKEAKPIEALPKDRPGLILLQNTIKQINYILSQMPKTSLGDKAIHQSIEVQGKKFPLLTHVSNHDRSTRIICLNAASSVSTSTNSNKTFTLGN